MQNVKAVRSGNLWDVEVDGVLYARGYMRQGDAIRYGARIAERAAAKKEVARMADPLTELKAWVAATA